MFARFCGRFLGHCTCWGESLHVLGRGPCSFISEGSYPYYTYYT